MKTKFTILIIFSFLLVGRLQSQWVRCYGIDSVSIVWSLAASGNIAVAGTENSNINGVFLSTDNGLNWTLTALNNKYIYSLAIKGSDIFAGTFFDGIYLSSDNGLNWTHTFTNNQSVFALASNFSNIFAGTSFGIYLSTNNGNNWTQSSFNNRSINALDVNGNNVFAGTEVSGVYLSTNNGVNWDQTSLDSISIFALVVNGNNVFIGTYATGVYLSTNNGSNWTQTSLNDQNIYSLAISGNNVFAGTTHNGFYLSTNNGINWTQHNEGFPNLITIESFCVVNNYIIAGTLSNGVWRRYIPELIGIEKISSELPTQFELYQNYPNPFNPKTKIKFEIPSNVKNETSNVKLIIYDILGKEVATLVNEKLNPGTYEVEWDASNYPSGIYFYKIETELFIETKKMILLK